MVDDPKKSVTEQKYGKELVAAGYTLVPNVFFQRMKALGLDPLDMVIILHLLAYWWDVNNRPHPSKVTLAHAIGVDSRTIQRRIAAMEIAGFIRREQRRDSPAGSSTNVYHLDGLIKAAIPFAVEEIRERGIARAAKLQRLKRMKPVKPKLTVV